VSNIIGQVRYALAERYAVDREIGRGGMAIVYLARDLKHDRPVAIKVFRPELAASLGTERFLREIQIVARLQHPHILPLHDSGTADGILYYVMPFVEGESLAIRLEREGPLQVDNAVAIASEVASALDYAHRQGVVHRDIKPANILLSGGHAVVTDFGIARAVSAAAATQITQEGSPIGTPSYMSPEQAAADTGEIDARTDIYSLGCVLYEMLAGRPPYQGPTLEAIFAKVLAGATPELRQARPDTPKHVADVTAKALAKSPGQRFATGAEFAAALQSGQVDWRPGRRRRGVVLGAAGLLAVLAVAWWLRPRSLESAVASDAQVIAVVPFTTSGPNVAVLGEGMVDLLSTNLDAVGGIRTVDTRTVLHRWRQRADEDGVDLEGSLAVGREVSAGSVLLGSIVEAGPEVRLSAELRTVRGERLAQATADGPADSVLALVDSLSLRLLREIWRSRQPLPDLRVSAITTGSLNATRAYLQGEQYYRRSHWDSAAAAFGTAIGEDPTFALALYRMGQAISWLRGHGSPQAVRLGQAAAEFAERLPPRERTLVRANQLFQAGRLAALDTLRAYVTRYPNDAEGWHQYGDVQYRARSVIAMPPEELYAPFDRGYELDSTLAPALLDPLELSLLEGDSTRFARYFGSLAQSTSARQVERFELARRLLWSPPDSAVALIGTVAFGPGFDPVREAMRLLRLMIGVARLPTGWSSATLVAAVDTILAATPPNDARRAELIATKVRTLNAAGRLEDAGAQLTALFETTPVLARTVSLLPVLAGYAPASSAGRALRQLADAQSLTTRGDPETDYWRALGALGQGHGDTARLRAAAGLAGDTTGNTLPYRGLFTAVQGWADLIAGRLDRGGHDAGGGSPARRFGGCGILAVGHRGGGAASLPAGAHPGGAGSNARGGAPSPTLRDSPRRPGVRTPGSRGPGTDFGRGGGHHRRRRSLRRVPAPLDRGGCGPRPASRCGPVAPRVSELIGDRCQAPLSSAAGSRPT
jgi:serine/threonine-protein kinase